MEENIDFLTNQVHFIVNALKDIHGFDINDFQALQIAVKIQQNKIFYESLTMGEGVSFSAIQVIARALDKDFKE